MTFLASRFVREKVWSGELLDGIALYCVDKFFVDRVLKIPVFILFDGSRWLRNPATTKKRRTARKQCAAW